MTSVALTASVALTETALSQRLCVRRSAPVATIERTRSSEIGTSCASTRPGSVRSAARRSSARGVSGVSEAVTPRTEIAFALSSIHIARVGSAAVEGNTVEGSTRTG